MLVASWVNKKPAVGATRTYEDFYKLLGDHPHLMGVMAKMYQNNTATFLTEALGNVYYNGKAPSKFQPIDSMSMQWDIDINFVKKIRFAAVPVGDGANGSTILMHFDERYYELYDTFKIDKSKQMCIVLSTPVNKAVNKWEYLVQVIDSDYSQTLDVSACQVGDETRWISNNQPEASEIGYTKYQSNFETHRAWMTEHRCDIDFTSRYALNEQKFIKIAKRDNGVSQEAIFGMSPKEKTLLDSFAEAKNNNLLWGKSTMDKNGHCTVHTQDGRPIISGDGVIPQIERYCNKEMYATNKLTISVIQRVLKSMNERAKSPIGNNYVFVVNEVLWQQIALLMEILLRTWHSTPSVVYSMKANGNVKVGATYNAYEFAGNTISFTVDRALSKEYPYSGYGICLDTTPDTSENKPAIAAFTLKGSEFVQSKLLGHGGIDGSSSGIVSTPVEASKLIVSGYSGIAVFAPYKAFILEEA
jgi:hypothetical protein